jgi:hypothetical protein
VLVQTISEGRFHAAGVFTMNGIRVVGTDNTLLRTIPTIFC